MRVRNIFPHVSMAGRAAWALTAAVCRGSRSLAHLCRHIVDYRVQTYAKGMRHCSLEQFAAEKMPEAGRLPERDDLNNVDASFDTFDLALQFGLVPGRTAEVVAGGQRVGMLGQVLPSVAAAFDIDQDVYDGIITTDADRTSLRHFNNVDIDTKTTGAVI